MSDLRPVPFPVLVVIYGFGVLVYHLRSLGLRRGMPPLSRRAKLWTVIIEVLLFTALAALNAFQNHRLGMRQF